MKHEIEPTIAVNKDYCILCGACVNACPGEDIIVLQQDRHPRERHGDRSLQEDQGEALHQRTSRVKEGIPGQVSIKIMEKA